MKNLDFEEWCYVLLAVGSILVATLEFFTTK